MKCAINRRVTQKWKADVEKSVLFYNDWFMRFAPSAYVEARKSAIAKVEAALERTAFLSRLTPDVVGATPEIVSILRMATMPPLARDRLSGLADIPKTVITAMESGKPTRNGDAPERIVRIVGKLLDTGIMPWLRESREPTKTERLLAAAVIGDRVCGSLADPLIRNEQERRQFRALDDFLAARGYRPIEAKDVPNFKAMPPGTFAHHLNVSVKVGGRTRANIPVDVAVMRRDAAPGDLPLLVECKSAGDFTNTNKRRKEEAVKIDQLKSTYGNGVDFNLFLCGYFDSGYLGYEAAEGIDWVWEHRIADLEKAGV